MFKYIVISFSLIFLFACTATEEIDDQPDVSILRDGLKVSAAIGYSASLATQVFFYDRIPEGANFQQFSQDDFDRSGIIQMPLMDREDIPFNENIGEVTIAGIWSDNTGVISMIFTDTDLENFTIDFIGFYTVPVIV